MLPRGARMRKEVEQVFARYAMKVTVEHRETVQRTRAFVQSVRPERGDEPFEVIPPGAVEERFWRYLGSAETPLEMGDRVICGGEKLYRAERGTDLCRERNRLLLGGAASGGRNVCRRARKKRRKP